jgi:carboxymethylenebutenolidase
MNLFQKYLLDEFVEDYQENRISRREALKLIASIIGSMVVANSILAACTPLDEEATVEQSLAASPTPSVPVDSTATSAPASSTPAAHTSVSASSTPPPTDTISSTSAGEVHGTVTVDDPMVNAGAVEFPGQDESLQGYLSRPASDEPAPLILVCHENRGLTEHIQDVTRRLAKAGYVALAVDLLSRQGGSAALNSGEIPGLLTATSPDQYVQDFLSGWRWLQDQDFAQTERVGMTGFCFGGGVTWRVATQIPELKAAVPFYGPHPELSDVPTIQAAVLAIYGERDSRINQGIAAIEEAMQQSGKIYDKIIYPDSDHAFFNDSGSRYNPIAAQDAWMQMLAWFQQYI